ncbi:MAG: alanine racemase, partial [Omnitrophica WOR_2 bacterium]
LDQINLATQAAERVGRPARLHLKVDTGMSRVGVQPEDALLIARTIAHHSSVRFEGIFTHFAKADEPDQPVNAVQEDRFREVLQALAAEGIQPQIIHAANSATALYRPGAYFDMVRAGISLYGLNPSGQEALPAPFRAALTWKAVLSQVKVLPPGRGISYGHEYTTRSYERIGTVPVGYADGLRRTTGNQVLVGGKRVPLVGRVCMDQVMIQLDTVPEAVEGDEVVLIGKQGDEVITAEEIAQRWGTINYEVVCGIGGRVPRIYDS